MGESQPQATKNAGKEHNDCTQQGYHNMDLPKVCFMSLQRFGYTNFQNLEFQPTVAAAGQHGVRRFLLCMSSIPLCLGLWQGPVHIWRPIQRRNPLKVSASKTASADLVCGHRILHSSLLRRFSLSSSSTMESASKACSTARLEFRTPVLRGCGVLAHTSYCLRKSLSHMSKATDHIFC